jgi:putative intracellular protease/amidase
VHELILAFVRADKPILAECYGVACLAFARDWENRTSIIAGKRVTGHCKEYDYKDGTGFVGSDINMGPPPYPLEYILRDATAPGGAYVGNVGRVTSVIVDHPFVTARSTPDSFPAGRLLVDVLENGLRRHGW